MYKYLFASTLLTLAISTPTHAKIQAKSVEVQPRYVVSDYAKTKYPIVFAHGLLGFVHLGPESFGLDYWYQILPDLARQGAKPWAASMSPFNTSEVRGEQFVQQIEDILAITGSDKVNLIGHSHGGHAVRYAAGVMPEHVASVLSVAGASTGTVIASDILKIADTTQTSSLLNTLINAFGKVLIWAQGLNQQDYPHYAYGAGQSVSVEGAALFAKKFPLGLPKTKCGDGAAKEDGIVLYSMTGNTSFSSALDPADYITKAMDVLSVSKEGKNDGIVSVCSSKFGKTLRDDYYWTHLDQVNQVLGIKGLLSADPISVYRQHANRLKLQGL